jgi:putative endonuclease
MSRYQYGCAAEDNAARFYESQGAEVLSRRFRVREGEVDLVARIGNCLIFVEVKARKTLNSALEAISPHQLARIQSAALAFLSRNGLGLDTEMRFDAVVVDHAGEMQVLENVTL